MTSSWLAGAACACLALACATKPPEPAKEVAEPVLVDALGRRYAVRSLEKAQAVRVDEAHARTRVGITIELVGEDERHWHFKYYLHPQASAAAQSSAPEPPRTEPAPSVEIGESAALRFEPIGSGLPQSGQWREGFDLADFDGDGVLDLAHGPPRKGRRTPRIWLGDGRGGFAPWQAARFPPLAYDYGDARAGDFDGDGRLDLALAVHLHGLLLLLGDGRGGFRRGGAGLDFTPDGAAAFSSRAIRALDFDRDGHLDIAALGEGPRLAGAPGASGRATMAGGARGIVLYRGTGAGAFERRDRGTGAAEIFGASLALGDFDGDGRLDFATSSSQLGRSDLVQLQTSEGLSRAEPIGGVPSQAYVRAVAAADFDRDGRSDLALAYVSIASGAWWSGVDVLLSRDTAEWHRVRLAAAEGRNDVRALAAADLDGDGAADLAALDASGALAVYRGSGQGSFIRERLVPPPFPGGCRGAHLAIADLDRDGFGDLVASFGQEAPPASDTCRSQGGFAAWRTVRNPPGR